MKKPVVLSIYYKHKQGGFTKRLYRAYRAIAAANYQLIYVSTEELPVQGEGIRAVIIPVTSREDSLFYWPEFYIRATLKLRQLSKQHSVRQHFVFSFFYSATSILSAVGLPVKTITLVRNNEVFDARFKRYGQLRARVHQLIEFIGVRFSHKILTTNGNMQQDIVSRTGCEHKFAVLPNDITTQRLAISHQAPQRPTRIATVSMINPNKNHRLMIEALAQLKHLDWEYLIIGSDNSGGHHIKALQQLAEEKGITERIHFLGWLDNAADYLIHCQLFAFPSLTEGSPNALLEAMGYGLPCLASRIPEVIEVLSNDELQFDPRQPLELRDKLEHFITNPDYAAQIRQKTLEESNRFIFDWDKKVTELLTETEDKAMQGQIA